MRIIAHRGNINGPKPQYENKPSYIANAIQQGYDCEIDVWFENDKFVLGHDEPQYDFPFELLETYYNKLWIHAKNWEAFIKLRDIDRIGTHLNYFWHQTDDYVLTSKGFIWTFPEKSLSYNSICVMPEKHKTKPVLSCYGVCTDYPKEYEDNL